MLKRMLGGYASPGYIGVGHAAWLMLKHYACISMVWNGLGRFCWGSEEEKIRINFSFTKNIRFIPIQWNVTKGLVPFYSPNVTTSSRTKLLTSVSLNFLVCDSLFPGVSWCSAGCWAKLTGQARGQPFTRLTLSGSVMSRADLFLKTEKKNIFFFHRPNYLCNDAQTTKKKCNDGCITGVMQSIWWIQVQQF